jgi:excisionase family DNA binding protein
MPRLPWQSVTGPDASRQPGHGIEPLLSLDEVTRLLRISESGVYRLVRSGELPRVKVGKRTLFEPDEIRHFIALRRDEHDNTTRGRGSNVPGPGGM